MDSSSEDDSWATFESFDGTFDDSELECSTCSSSNDEDCSYKRSEVLGDCTNIAAVKKPKFQREDTFKLTEKVENDLEEEFCNEDEEEVFDWKNWSSSSCSSGSEEDEDVPQEPWTAVDTRQTFPFIATPFINAGSATTPIDFFYLVFDQDFVQFLVSEINTRGTEFSKEKKKAFTPTDVNEVYTLLCTHFMMGFTTCILDNMLFGDRPSLNTNFNTYMRSERYDLLFGLLTHRETKIKTREDYRSWYEVAKPIVDKFNNVMKTLMVPGRDLNIEEDTVLHFNEHNQIRRIRDRIRLHFLSDDNGIFQRVFVIDPELQEKVRGDQVARTLMEEFLDAGRALYTASDHYVSVAMAEDFLNRKTYLSGFLKKNRPRNPTFLKLKVKNIKMPVRTYQRKNPSDEKSEEAKKSEKMKASNDGQKPKAQLKDQKTNLIIHGYNEKGVCVEKIVRPHFKFNLLSTEFDSRPAVDSKFESNIVEQVYNHTQTKVIKRNLYLSKCGPSLQRKHNRHVAYLINALCVNAYLMYKVKTGKKLKFVNFLEDILYQMLPLEDKADKENAGRNKRPRRQNRANRRQ